MQKRPKSPEKKVRALKRPPAGEEPAEGKMDPEVPTDLSEETDGCPVNLLKLDLHCAENLTDWSNHVKDVFKLRSTFTDLGRHLLQLMSTMPTPLGNFVRSYCLAAQPLTSSGVAKTESHGDILPIPVWRITTQIENVDDNNIDWLKAMVAVINFQYCTGWAKPICVPIKDTLSPCQVEALSRMALTVNSNILSADTVMAFADCDRLLSSKKYDYAGRPVEYMEDLECSKVLMAWPKVGQAGIQPIEAFLTDETKASLQDPAKLLLPRERMPTNAIRSRVRASDAEWFKIVQAAWERGMMKPVDDSKVPRDRQGHLITNGAGAVFKEKMRDGKPVAAQRFISIMCPVNAVTVPLAGSQDTLPYIGQLTGLLLEETESLYLESEDLQSAFNLFSMPDQWLPFFAYSKKVDGAAMNLQPGVQIRPALCVVPMGWHSAAGLVQEAVRDLVFNRAGVPKQLSVEKQRPLPAGKSLAVVYLDNYDEIEIIKSIDVDLSREGVVMSDRHRRFNEACDQAGLPRNEGKQLIHAYAGGMQGGEFDGRRGVLKIGSDKLRNYVQLSLALLAKRSWNEFQMRHWSGKTAFLATFRRSLFSGMAGIFPLFEKAKTGDVAPSQAVVDEVVVLCIQAGLSQTNLRAVLSPEVSCTDASPYGGGSCIATCFKPDVNEVPPASDFVGLCGHCENPLDVATTPGYHCPNECGVRACCVVCIAAHRRYCPRDMLGKACFGERFSGPNCPLTKAVALAGVFVQPPLDKLRDGNWDFFSPSGRDCLEGMEDDGHLSASHWAPECKTFTAARGRPIQTTSGRWIQGPPALRSRDYPWGLPSLSKANQIKTRQGNAMGKRSLQGLKDAHAQGRFASLEHPWWSHLWFTPEALEICDLPGFFTTAFSHCCFGGRRTKWTALVHNMPEMHRMMHAPTCEGHDDLLPYEVHDEGDTLEFDTAAEAEYPWRWCLLYAECLKNQLKLLKPSPSAGVYDEEGSLMAALRSSTRGFQNPAVASRTAQKIMEVLQTMTPGAEREHLKLMLRNVCLRGTDVKLAATAEDGSQSWMTPYPAYKWEWKVKLAFAWKQDQHINILEVSAFLVEFRRRTRQKSHLGVSLAKTYDQLDQQLADYINHLFQEGEALTKAGWLLSGIKRLYPRVRRELAIAQQWYNNWCREHTPHRATPLTWPLLQAFVGLCLYLKWDRLATVLLVSFVFFLRTGESLSLCGADILCDLSDGTVLLRLASSKTSPGAQQSLAHFDINLAHFLAFQLRKFEETDPIWSWSMSYFRQCFTGLCTFFELAPLHLVPYSIRRGGATYFYVKYSSTALAAHQPADCAGVKGLLEMIVRGFVVSTVGAIVGLLPVLALIIIQQKVMRKMGLAAKIVFWSFIVLYFLLSLFVVLVFIAAVSDADGVDFLVGVLTAVLRTILVTPWLGVSFFLLVIACVEVDVAGSLPFESVSKETGRFLRVDVESLSLTSQESGRSFCFKCQVSGFEHVMVKEQDADAPGRE
eukprot:s410_g11.t1